MSLLSFLMESTTTTDAAIRQLTRNASELAVLYNVTIKDQLKALYAADEHDDMWRTSKFIVGRTRAKWFTGNYLSTTRHTSSINGMKEALMVLSKDPICKSISSDLRSLASLQVNMDRQVRQDLEISYSAHTQQLASQLPSALSKLSKLFPESAQSLNNAASKLHSANASCTALWESLHTAWKQEHEEPSPESIQKQKKKEGANLAGSQASAADMLVSQILAALPDKKAAHDIRTAIARSENKLQALQIEFTKRGIKV